MAMLRAAAEEVSWSTFSAQLRGVYIYIGFVYFFYVDVHQYARLYRAAGGERLSPRALPISCRGIPEGDVNSLPKRKQGSGVGSLLVCFLFSLFYPKDADIHTWCINSIRSPSTPFLYILTV